MSFTSKVIAPWCKKHGNDDVVDAPAATTFIGGNVCNWHGDFVSFVPIAYMEGDDDDDGGYDYAPAA
ncbi:hypothetical protein AAZX31_17G115500 [Glycine max]|uniref:Uncharacterized protein n=2 Tax=Glycine subgen. Soja TaxID=1462606 RepID=K7ML89_SOYBN|nr:uncharacterized protein LOC112999953 [Glycine max]KAG4932966.1 hypothetical protein JHK87_046968 [Glycine soja]KAG4930204.1 hypothetical protein JHK86_047165 [Glycine max]KAG4943095.1 hypothetical protein JHK85_047741 [Glycine max]KAG5097417.1 hypothetical protein JHK82_047271 [Glycine max]KAG5102205.1 hypothetical protein JHK84_047174 [Glycine max]|eukprot:XP_025982186.1 uncharacterized protein LOC112999953 [Glycine max]